MLRGSFLLWPANKFFWNSLLLSTFWPSFYYSPSWPWKLIGQSHRTEHKRWLAFTNSPVVIANICIPKGVQCSWVNEFCHWLQWEVWALTHWADVSSAGNLFSWCQQLRQILLVVPINTHLPFYPAADSLGFMFSSVLGGFISFFLPE